MHSWEPVRAIALAQVTNKRLKRRRFDDICCTVAQAFSKCTRDSVPSSVNLVEPTTGQLGRYLSARSCFKYVEIVLDPRNVQLDNRASRVSCEHGYSCRKSENRFDLIKRQ